MVIYTAKFSKKRLVTALIVLVLVVVAIVLLLPGRDGTVKGNKGKLGATAQQTLNLSSKVKDQADRVAFIAGLGYSVSEGSEKSKEVVIPKEFDDTYELYNALQVECGFDLAKYKGKRCTLYTYGITGYEGFEDVMVDLIIYREKIIGGGIYTASLDGFMHGLKMQE